MENSASATARKILYAEDNPDDAFIFKIAFKRAKLPHSLSLVDDGQEAIAWLSGNGDFANRERHPLPDLLILDLKMPRKSGFDVLEWLKVSNEFAQLPVIVLSSSDDPGDLKRAHSLGVTEYFRKSASCEEVIQRLALVS